jgi:hypothetical protein
MLLFKPFENLEPATLRGIGFTLFAALTCIALLFEYYATAAWFGFFAMKQLVEYKIFMLVKLIRDT